MHENTEFRQTFIITKPDEVDGKTHDDANTLMSSLDTTYLLSYAIFMFVSGMIADRLDLRYFLSGGMICSGIITIIFGLSKYWGIHSLIYYDFVQVLCVEMEFKEIKNFVINYPYKRQEYCNFLNSIPVCHRNFSNKWLAWRRGSYRKLVWSRKKRSYYGHMEFAHIDWKYTWSNYRRYLLEFIYF